MAIEAEVLSQALKVNKTLTSLNLDCTYLCRLREKKHAIIYLPKNPVY